MRKLKIQSLGNLMVIGLFLLIVPILTTELSAQYVTPLNPAASEIKQIWSRNKEFVANVFLDRKITRVGKVDWQGNIGRTRWLWSMDGAFQVGWLSNDGEYFVAGNEGLNFLPINYNKDQVMLSFFKQGRLINQIRLNQLITDFNRLRKTTSNYRWAKYFGLNICGYLAVETIEGRRILLDVTTGRPAEFKPEKTYRVSKWKTYQDMMRCYEFQYPDDYLIKEFFVQGGVHEGTPLGQIFLEKDKVWLIEGFVEDTAEYGTDYAARQTFEEFVFDRAMAMHSADGPNGSTYATDVARKELFTNPNNLNVIEFYLTVVDETYFEDNKTKIKKRTAGPIYAVSISQTDDSYPYQVLFLKLLPKKGKKYLQEKEILKKIVNTVGILK
jgi:hypothetical protein